jgi:hypothetical protein
VTASSTASPIFVVEFSTARNMQISGEVDGPGIVFQNVGLYSGVFGSGTLISPGNIVCNCGPETSNTAYTALTGGGGPKNYFIELSDPTTNNWSYGSFPSNAESSQGGDGLFGIKLSASAPELDPRSTVAGITLLLGCLAVFSGRQKRAQEFIS